MNLIRRVNSIPLTTFLLFSMIVGFIILLPLSLVLIQQQTKLPSSAAPLPSPIEPIKVYGPIPHQQPVITKVYPFVGKRGDVVFIVGSHLGNNPKKSKIVLGKSILHQTDIISWKDNQIVFKIPSNTSSGFLHLEIGPWVVGWSIPLTVYTYDTPLKLRYVPPFLSLRGPTERVKNVYVWLDKSTQKVLLPSDLSKVSFSSPPMGVALIGQNNQLLSFYIDPAEFGF